jgi:hypothetical protein
MCIKSHFQNFVSFEKASIEIFGELRGFGDSLALGFWIDLENGLPCRCG